MIVRKPCCGENCTNTMLVDGEESLNGDILFDAYCLECRENNPFKELVIQTKEELFGQP